MPRGWFYVFYMLFLVGVIYVVDLILGKLYARYVLAYTGLIFMAGMLLGQRSERKGMESDQSEEVSGPPGEGEGVGETWAGERSIGWGRRK